MVFDAGLVHQSLYSNRGSRATLVRSDNFARLNSEVLRVVLEILRADYGDVALIFLDVGSAVFVLVTGVELRFLVADVHAHYPLVGSVQERLLKIALSFRNFVSVLNNKAER